jgi:predicted transcriptional regulator
VSGAKTLLLSLRPRFARAILEGSKTVDVRRRPMRAYPGSAVVLYSAAPVMAIVGIARVAKTSVASADEVWEHHRDAVALDRAELDAYLDGRVAHLLHLEGVRSLNPPVAIGGIGNMLGFRAPQSFRYLSECDPPEVRALVADLRPVPDHHSQ